MEIGYKIQYYPIVLEQHIPKLSTTIKARVQFAIQEKLSSHPDIFGKPLRRSLKGVRSLRVGDYRVLFKISEKTLYVVAILHRSVVY
jgi:mRNA interferase RelE/StbE